MRYFVCSIMSMVSSWMYAGHEQALSIPQGVLIESGISAHFVAHFALFLSTVLLWTIAWGKLLKVLLRLPVIAGQIIGGILLGPSLMDVASWHVFSHPLSVVDRVSGAWYALASSDIFIFVLILISSTLTVSYLLWIAGHETDVRDLMKVGVTATTAGILGALVPIFMTVAAVITFFGYSVVQGVGLGLIFAATSVSIPVAMLFSQNKMHLKSSKATLGAAIVDDIFAVVLLSMFFIAVQQGVFGYCVDVNMPCNTTITESLVYMLVAFTVIFFTGYFVIPPVIEWLRKHHQSHLIPSIANGSMLLYFTFAELVGGLAGITGAYFAGLFHQMGDKKHAAEKVISPFVNTLLLPLFLGSIGLQLNIRILTKEQWIITAVLLIVAIASKLIGCFISTGMSNMLGHRDAHKWTMLESYLFGASMVARGEVGLVVSTILRGSGVISAEQYAVAIVVIVLTTISTPILLAIGFSLLEATPGKSTVGAGKVVNIGMFDHIDTAQMFNIMVRYIENSDAYRTVVQIAEGKRILNIECRKVKIILCPDEGIIIEGDRTQATQIIDQVRQAILADTQRLTYR